MSTSEIAAHVTETTVLALFSLTCFNAVAQGRRWLFTLLWGAIFGFLAEVFLVHLPEPRYLYGTRLFWLNLWDVPVCVGLGWGMIIYVASWTAQRLQFASAPITAYIAGLLGVNLDLSLDPVANKHGFWTWQPLNVPDYDPDTATFFKVPFDNFVAWMAIIGFYSLFVRLVFHWVNRWAYDEQVGPPGNAAVGPSRKGSIWADLLVPPVGAVLAAGLFVGVRGYAEKIYLAAGRVQGWLGNELGQAIIFGILFIPGLVLLWRQVFRTARNQEVNWLVLGVVFYFHALSLGLLFAGGIRDYTALVVLIPTNLVAGMVAYVWPSIDVLCSEPASVTADKYRVPRMIFRTLSSYGGFKQRALVCTPACRDELEAVLLFAQRNGKRLTFRAGGQAFDTQSLNHEIVVSLEKFKSVALSKTRDTVTAGCGATWAQVLAETLPHGRVPYIMVTSSAATVGGTLSSHSISRFSPSFGREGRYIERLTVITPDGKLHEGCSPEGEDRDLFHGVIAGLGYLGAVLEVTYRLREVPENARVKTRFELVEGLAAIGKAVKTQQKAWHTALTAAVVEQGRSCRSNGHGAATDAATEDGLPALSAAVNLRGGVWSLIASSRYVKQTTALDRSIFHDPHSVRHFVLQLFAAVPGLRALGYALTYLAYRGRTREFVDDAFGYTFFEDGNRRFKRVLNALGVPCRTLQQTYMIPLADDGDEGAQLTAFLREADEYLERSNLSPALIDVVYVGQDGCPFPLSSSAGDDSFAVTFTFERLFRPLLREQAAAAHLSGLALARGGRVHLVKNVCASIDEIKAMYPEGLAEMTRLRDKYGAAKVLRNEFAGRILSWP